MLQVDLSGFLWRSAFSRVCEDQASPSSSSYVDPNTLYLLSPGFLLCRVKIPAVPASWGASKSWGRAPNPHDT